MALYEPEPKNIHGGKKKKKKKILNIQIRNKINGKITVFFVFEIR